MNNNNNRLPDGLKRSWIPLIYRLQGASRSQGYSIVNIVILVGPDGCPRAWTEPRVTKIEPFKSSDEILAIFGKTLMT